MAASQQSKGGGAASNAALHDDEDQMNYFKEWKEKRKEKSGLNYFPNSPPSPTGK